MRLQLSPTQITAFAAAVGPLQQVELKEAIQKVMLAFEKGLDPFTRKDLTAVLMEAGVTGDIEKDPVIWATVSGEIKRYTTNTSEKGFYTQKGSTAPRPSRFAPPSVASASSPTADDSKPGDGLEIKEVAGVYWSPLLTGSVEEAYVNDVGLRRIAVSQSTCFGSYSPRAVPCRECPLASFCVQASISNLPGFVAALDATTEANIKVAIAASLAPSKIDSILGASEPKVVDPIPTPPIPPALDLAAFPKGTSIINVPVEAFCSGCNSLIVVNSEGVYIPSRGLFHPTCAKAA